MTQSNPMGENPYLTAAIKMIGDFPVIIADEADTVFIDIESAGIGIPTGFKVEPQATDPIYAIHGDIHITSYGQLAARHIGTRQWAASALRLARQPDDRLPLLRPKMLVDRFGALPLAKEI